MTAFPHQLEGTETVHKAKEVMTDNDIRHLVVTRGGDINSIISDRDIDSALAAVGRHNDEALIIDDICPLHTFMADISDPLEEILEAMADKKLGAVIVLKDGDLAGIFTANDACKFYAELIREVQGPDLPPEAA